MIKILFAYKSKTGEVKEGERDFNDKRMALRFLYGAKGKNIIILGWRCDDVYDHEWLERRFTL